MTRAIRIINVPDGDGPRQPNGPVSVNRVPMVRAATPSSDSSDEDSDEEMEEEDMEGETVDVPRGQKRTRDAVDADPLEESSAGPSSRRRIGTEVAVTTVPSPVVSRQQPARPVRPARRSALIEHRLQQRRLLQQQATAGAEVQAATVAAAIAQTQALEESRVHQVEQYHRHIMAERRRRLDEQLHLRQLPALEQLQRELDLQERDRQRELEEQRREQLREMETRQRVRQQEMAQQRQRERQQREQAILRSYEPESLRRSSRINQSAVPRTFQNIISANLPTQTFHQAGANNLIAENSSECSICYERFRPRTRVRVLNCSHVYHKDCIDEWFTGDRNSCPLCRRRIV